MITLHRMADDLCIEAVPWREICTPALRGEWMALLASLPRIPVFHYPQWLEIAWRHGIIKPWLLLLIRHRQHLIGLLPLQKCTPWTAEVCYHPFWEDFPPVLIDAEAEEAAWRSIARWFYDNSGLGVLSFGRRHLSDGLEMIQHIARTAGLFPLLRPVVSDVWLTLPETWEAYVAGLGKSHRKALPWRENQLQKDFGNRYTIDIARGTAIDPRILDELIRLHRARWQGQRGSYFDDPRNIAFYREAVHWAAGQEIAVLPALRLEEHAMVVASLFHIAGQDTAYAHCIARDVEAISDHYSPGTVLNARVYRWAIAQGIRHFALGIGTTYYKTLFGGCECPRAELFFARSPWHARILSKIDSAGKIITRHMDRMQKRVKDEG